MRDDSHMKFIETYQGIPIELNLTSGHFEAAMGDGCFMVERLVAIRMCIRQALLLQRELHLAKNGESV